MLFLRNDLFPQKEANNMTYDLKTGAKRVIKNLRELASITSDDKGAQRVAWTPIWKKSCLWWINKAKDLGASVSIDPAGNIWATIQGKTQDSIAIGSHIDCVPNGGWLDGALGVVAALEVLQKYGLEKEKPAKTIHAICWSDEEGARFGRSVMGSSAACNTLNIQDIAHSVDNNGIGIKEVLSPYNVELENLLKAHEEFKKRHIIASLELHIEQGPVLEDQNKDVACVYGITGIERHYIKFIGQAAHAGSFPTEMRSDAFLAAAESALAFKEIALKHHGVCTVGKVKVHPDVVTIVPDQCIISLDQRSIDQTVLEAMLAQAKNITEKIALKNNVKTQWSKIFSTPPTIFEKSLVNLCKQAVKEETGEATEMYSGPLHDSAELAKIVPAVMMFAMSTRGLSHCKEEDTPEEKLETAICAFFRLVDKVMLN